MIHDQWSCVDSGREGSPEIYCQHFNKDGKTDAEINITSDTFELFVHPDLELKVGARENHVEHWQLFEQGLTELAAAASDARSRVKNGETSLPAQEFKDRMMRAWEKFAAFDKVGKKS